MPRLSIILVILAAAAVYLIGNDRVPLWDRDEPRNAQAARQMFQSGDWVVPHFLDKLRTAKPPFTYWCQVMAMHALGDNNPKIAELKAMLAKYGYSTTESGYFDPNTRDVVSAFQSYGEFIAGRISDGERQQIVERSCPGPGSPSRVG